MGILSNLFKTINSEGKNEKSTDYALSNKQPLVSENANDKVIIISEENEEKKVPSDPQKEQCDTDYEMTPSQTIEYLKEKYLEYPFLGTFDELKDDNPELNWEALTRYCFNLPTVYDLEHFLEKIGVYSRTDQNQSITISPQRGENKEKLSEVAYYDMHNRIGIDSINSNAASENIKSLEKDDMHKAVSKIEIPPLDKILEDDELYNKSFKELYGIALEWDCKDKVVDLNISPKVKTRLLSGGVKYFYDFIELSYIDLQASLYLDAKSFRKIDVFFRDYIQNNTITGIDERDSKEQLIDTIIDEKNAIIYNSNNDNMPFDESIECSEIEVEKGREEIKDNIEGNNKNIDKLDESKITENKDESTSSDNIPLGELFNVNKDYYMNAPLENLGLSTRSYNICKRVSDKGTIEELLAVSLGELRLKRGFGAKCEKEISAKIDSLVKNDDLVDASMIAKGKHIGISGNVITHNLLINHKDEIICGDFAFLQELPSDERINSIKEKYEDAYSNLGREIVTTALDNKAALNGIIHLLETESRKYDRFVYVSNILKNKLLLMDAGRRHEPISKYFSFFSNSSYVIDRLKKIEKDNNIAAFTDFLRFGVKLDDTDLILVRNFIYDCSYNLNDDVDYLLNGIYKNDRERKIIQCRANGESLKEIGDKLNLTRERVRQIESKVKRFFINIEKRKRILKKICLLFNTDIIKITDIESVFHEMTKEIVYIISICDCDEYSYNKEFGLLIVGDNDLLEKTEAFLDLLPETFSYNQYIDIIETGLNEYSLDKEILISKINKEYSKTGSIYHRKSLTKKAIYGTVLKKYYPNGLWIYGDNEIDGFKKHVYELYGDIDLSNNRAIRVRVAETGVLCDRGVYKAKQDYYISEKLAKDIERYIDHNSQSIIMLNTIYYIFEERLINEGVNNKYYLSGILHELFPDKWYFKRDYIAKDSGISSIYDEIIKTVKASVYPVTLKQISQKYPGVTDIVLHIALSDNSILNLFGQYIHSDRLKLSIDDIDYLKGVLEKHLEKDGLCTCTELFDYIRMDNPDILSRNFILIPFSVFSLYEFLFRDQFVFSRPFISKNEELINSNGNVLQELITNSDEISVAEIRSFAQDHKLKIMSFLELINSCNNTHFLESRDNIISIELTGITEEIGKIVENTLLNEVKERGTIPINQLASISRLPQIEVPWTEWLLYSTINRWGKRLEVGTSSTQLRYSVPIIGEKGMLDADLFQNITLNETELCLPDNLENIDELVMDIIDSDEEFL